jgi:hypothetical protein
MIDGKYDNIANLVERRAKMGANYVKLFKLLLDMLQPEAGRVT